MQKFKKILKLNPMFFLFLIWLVALFLRVYHLGSLPMNFMEDEVLSGYMGRYIIENGVDLYGNSWPIWYFDKFGDYYIIGPMYLAGLSTLIFGVTEFAIRFPAALFGSLVVFPTALLTYLVFQKKSIALISAAFISIMPWHLVLSRSTVEGIIGTTIFLTGICALLFYVKRFDLKYLLSATVLFLVTYFVYHPFRMYVPMVFFPLPFLFPAVRKKKQALLSILMVTAGFIILTGYITTTPWGSGRFEQTSIFSPLSGVEIRIQEQIYAIDQGKILEARIFHNKVIGYGREYVTQYVRYFSPNFLISSFGAESRYSIPDQGLIYYAYFFLIILSIIPFSRQGLNINQKFLHYLFFLILLTPIPAALTYYGSPNIHRSVFFSVMLVIPASYGAYKFACSKYGKFLITGVIFLILLEFVYFWHQYSVQSDLTTAIRRNDGYKQMIEYVNEHEQEYDEIFIPAEGTSAIYYLFYLNDFDQSHAGKFGRDAKIKSLGKIQFVESICPEVKHLSETGKVLYINRYDCPKSIYTTTLQKIQGRNELLGFRISTNKVEK